MREGKDSISEDCGTLRRVQRATLILLKIEEPGGRETTSEKRQEKVLHDQGSWFLFECKSSFKTSNYMFL